MKPPKAVDIQNHVDKHLSSGSKKKIGPVKKGALHAELHVPQGQKIGRARLEKEAAVAKREHNVTLSKRVHFALNMNKG